MSHPLTVTKAQCDKCPTASFSSVPSQQTEGDHQALKLSVPGDTSMFQAVHSADRLLLRHAAHPLVPGPNPNPNLTQKGSVGLGSTTLPGGGLLLRDAVDVAGVEQDLARLHAHHLPQRAGRPQDARKGMRAMAGTSLTRPASAVHKNPLHALHNKLA